MNVRSLDALRLSVRSLRGFCGPRFPRPAGVWLRLGGLGR